MAQRLPITRYALEHAMLDAGNKSMRLHGRKAWSAEDRRVATDVYYSLGKAAGYFDGDLDLTPEGFEVICGGGLSAPSYSHI